MILDYLFLLLGISGVFAIGAAVFLEATNRLGKDHKIFTWLNLYGSITLMLYSLHNKVWLFVILNTFLIGIGAYSLWRVFDNKDK